MINATTHCRNSATIFASQLDVIDTTYVCAAMNKFLILLSRSEIVSRSVGQNVPTSRFIIVTTKT